MKTSLKEPLVFGGDDRVDSAEKTSVGILHPDLIGYGVL